jgi:hypothetical protein
MSMMDKYPGTGVDMFETWILFGDCSLPLMRGDEPTALTLSSFIVTDHDRWVAVEWTSAVEMDLAGFNLYRTLDEDGELLRLNGAQIAGRGDALTGATYTFRDCSVSDGTTYYYWLEDLDVEGRATYHGPVSVTHGLPTDMPGSFVLSQNRPNPFGAVTEIEYALPVACDVRLVVYDVIGREVAGLVDERQPAGHKVVRWDGRNDEGMDVPAGVYMYALEANGRVEMRKTMFLK